jgi:hypothetical protein
MLDVSPHSEDDNFDARPDDSRSGLRHHNDDPPAPVDPDRPTPLPPRRPTPQPITSDAPTATEWLWKDHIPLSEITVLAGDPGLGKSLLALDLAARVTTGRPWPDEPAATPLRPPANVLFIGSEDNLTRTVLPRLLAAGADPSRVFIPAWYSLQGYRVQLPRDGQQLGDQIAAMGYAKLIIVDPLVPALDDSCRAGGRKGYIAFEHIQLLPFYTGSALLAVVHLARAHYRSAIHRVPGGTALAGVARSIFAAIRDRREENPDPNRRLLVPVKNNLAPEPPPLGYSIHDGHIVWHPESQPCFDPDSLLSIPPQPHGPDPVKLDACTAWLAAQLQPGPKSRRELIALARAAGFSLRTLERAKPALHIRSTPSPSAASILWSLHAGDQPSADTNPMPESKI